MRLRECGLVPWWWLKDETRDVSTWRHHDREVTRKAVGALDENYAHAVASNPVEHRLEARTLGHRIGSAHRRVVELVDSVRLGKRRDGRALRRSLSLSLLTFAAEEVRRLSNRVGVCAADIKVLYCFHQNNDDSKCEVAHTSLPIRPLKVRPRHSVWRQEGSKPKPARFTVGMVLLSQPEADG